MLNFSRLTPLNVDVDIFVEILKKSEKKMEQSNTQCKITLFRGDILKWIRLEHLQLQQLEGQTPYSNISKHLHSHTLIGIHL